MQNDNLEIIAINASDGRYYISEKRTLNGYRSRLSEFMINGESPLPTFENDWYCIKSEPKQITKMIKQPNTNYRYELQDKALMSSKLPEFIDREAVAVEDGYDWVWNDDMSQYRSLYKEIFDTQPDREEVYNFEMEVILNVTEILNPVKMSYKVPKTQYTNDGFTEINEKHVVYQLADMVILPGIVLPQRPCSLTSRQTYKIVRQHIKDHIDPKLATITSDYDFCFAVSRRVKLAQIVHYTVNVNQGSKRRRPKLVKKQRSERLESCFEMTYSPENYKGYSSIKSFEADTQEQLKKNIDEYCEGLIKFINSPLVECTHCNGDGLIIPKDFPCREIPIIEEEKEAK